MEKSPEAFRTISEVASWLDTPAHVLRFWESRFTQVKPVKRAGGRRYYRPSDMLLLGGIKKLLHEDGLTIRGVQKILREEGIRHVAALSPPLEDGLAHAAEAALLEGSGPVAEAFDVSAHRPQPTPEPDEAMLPGLDLERDARRPPEGLPPVSAMPVPGAAGPAETTAPATPPPTPADAAEGAETAQPPEDRTAVPAHPAEASGASPPVRADTAAGDGTPAPAVEARDTARRLTFRHADRPAPPDRQPSDVMAPTGSDGPPETAGAAPRPKALGVDLPRTDPADDDPAFAPAAPSLQGRLRDAGQRRAPTATLIGLQSALARLRALAARMDNEGRDDRD